MNRAPTLTDMESQMEGCKTQNILVEFSAQEREDCGYS